MVAIVAAHPHEAVFQPAATQIPLEFAPDVAGQFRALRYRLKKLGVE